MIRTAAIVGTGLIGTSVGLALSRCGVRVHLLDADPSAARVAAALGAGSPAAPAAPVDLAVLAVPPRHVARVLVEQQDRALALSYTDVASVKSATARAVSRGAADRSSYVGGHPMAGGESSGPLAARADLFEGRPWVLTPGAETSPAALNRTLAAVALCGGVPVVMEPEAHDRTVALVSHAPHLVASLMAARLQGAPPEVLRLAGRGFRDVTRIAGGDPGLWSDIICSNAPAVADTLGELMKDLETLVGALRAMEVSGPDALMAVDDLLSRGRVGRDSVHGRDRATPAGHVTLRIAVPDRPGELGRLLRATEEFGIGAEAVRLCLPEASAERPEPERSEPGSPEPGPGPGRAAGSAEMSARVAAAPAVAEAIRHKLVGGGWRVAVAAARPAA